MTLACPRGSVGTRESLPRVAWQVAIEVLGSGATPTPLPTATGIIEPTATPTPTSTPTLTPTNTPIPTNTPTATSTPLAGAATFIESGGEVVIEAENYTGTVAGTGNAANHDWESTTSYSGYSGASAMRPMPNTGVNTGTNTNGPALTYSIEFQTPGTYYVFIRGRGPSGGDDSVHVGLDGTKASGSGFTGFTSSAFTWQNHSDSADTTIVVPSPGRYDFYMWMREDGTPIDKIWLSTTQDAVSNGDTSAGPNQSAKGAAFEQDSTLFDYAGLWDEHQDSNYSGGSAEIADSLGEDVTFSYEGVDFIYYRKLGPNRGMVEICIDGTQPEDCTDVDNYSSTEDWQNPIIFEELYGTHTVEMSYSGRKDSESTGYLVSMDRVVIDQSTATPTPVSVTDTPVPTATPSSYEITVGANVSKDFEIDSSVEFNYTVAAGERRLLIVTFEWRRDTGQDLWYVRYDGVDLTQVATEVDPGDDFGAAMYYLVDPPVGTYEVKVGLERTGVAVGAFTLYGVDTSDPVVDFETWSGEGAASLSLVGLSGDMGVDIIGSDWDTTLTAGTGQTEQWTWHHNGGSWHMEAASSTEGMTASQVTMSYDQPSYRDTTYIAAVFRAWRPMATATPTPTAWPTPITQTFESAATFENTDSAWYYFGAWAQVDNAGDSGGSRQEAQIPWAGAQLNFNGNGFDFYYREKPDYGIADLYVDGSKVASVDQYNATETAGQSIHVTLADGDHVLEVRHLGRKNVDSSGYDINLDKVVVSSSATPTPTLTPANTSTPTPTFTPSPTPTYMQVTVGSIVSTDIETDYYIEFNHEIEPGDNRVLVVTFTRRRNSNQSLWGTTYDGESMTLAAGRCDPGGDYCAAMYYLVDPPVGTYEVKIGLNTSTVVAGAYTLYGVDQLDPIVDSDTTITWGSPASITLDSQAGDMGVDAIALDYNTGLTPGENQTEQWEQGASGSGWGMEGSSSTESGTTTSITMSQSFGSNVESGYVAAVFRALQGPYATPTPTNTPVPTATSTAETGWGRDFYSYSSSQPHAVESVIREGGTDNFEYDSIGNMDSRTESGTTWTQTFNEEGRLSQITDQTDTWKFYYDGDGVRVKQKNPDNTIVLFLGGGLYEVYDPDGQSEAITKYYSIARQRVMRDGAVCSQTVVCRDTIKRLPLIRVRWPSELFSIRG